jgi:hypothetical protein
MSAAPTAGPATRRAGPRPRTAGLYRRLQLAAPKGSPVARLADRLERRVEARALDGLLRDTQLQRIGSYLRVTHVTPDIGRARVQDLNLELVLDPCKQAGVEPFFVDRRPSGQTRVGIVADDWDAFVRALEAHDPTTYVSYHVPDVGWRLELVGRVTASELTRSATLTIHRFQLDPVNRVTYGSREACVVDRWDRVGDRLRASANNRRATDVPADEPRVSIVLGERTLPTIPPLEQPRFDDVTFPIDLVYLWVDGSDPAWMQRRAQRLAAVTGEPLHDLAVGDARFREHGELRYSFRSVAKYAPWFNHLYLVTDRQRPSWLVDDHPKLTVVDHRDIFDDPSHLPTFNSHAIASRLHHIPGLSEHYLVLNDDLLLTRDLAETHFFDSNGVGKFCLSSATLPAGAIVGHDLPHEAARKRARDLVFERHGRHVSQAFKHTPIANLRSWNEELERRYPDDFAATAASPFRSVGDLETCSWLHHYMGYFEGRTRPTDVPYDYFAVREEEQLSRLEHTRLGKNVTICLNDADEGDVPLPEMRARLTAVLDGLYPKRCEFERPTAPPARA